MEKFPSFIIFIPLLFTGFVKSEKLYGASVHWRPLSVNGTNKANEIVLSYKLIWQQGVLPKCPAPNTDSFCYYYSGGISSTKTLRRWQGYKWKCISGCSNGTTISDLSALYHTDVGTFHNISWEAAVEIVTFKFKPGDDQANVRIGLFDSNNRAVNGLAEATLSMAIRNDTRRANISPAINPLPYYRLPLGCSITIPFFPFDGDGDYVRCHWQQFPTTITDGSSAVLNEDKCELVFDANSTKGIQAGDSVTLSFYAEDFSYQPVRFLSLSEDITTGPFSRTPFMLFLYIGESTTSCEPGPEFIETGTLPPNYVGSYALPFNNAKLPFKIPIDDGQVVLTSGPRYMNFKFDDSPQSFQGTWANVSDESMTGIHQACGMTYTKYGVPGAIRCAALLVNEPNECPCPPLLGIDRTCRNLFEYHTCGLSNMSPLQHLQTIHQLLQTVVDQKQNISQLQGEMDKQKLDSCRSNDVKSSPDDLKLIVGLPVGLSLLWLIILVIITCMLKNYIDKKKQDTSINPGKIPSNGLPSAW